MVTSIRGSVLVAMWLAASARAADVFDPFDPSFENAATLTFESDDIDNAATTMTVESNGITFGFTAIGTSPSHLDGGGGFPGRPDHILSNGNGDSGLTLVINPPVSAIGFWAQAVDGCPGAAFEGSAEELVQLDATCSYSAPVFFGASGIGDISQVNVKRQGSIWTFDRIVFAAPGVIPTAEADVAVSVTTEDPVLLDGQPLAYGIAVGNAGPDTAPTVYLTDFLPADVYDSHDDFNANGAVIYWPDRELLRLAEPDMVGTSQLTITVSGTTPSYPDFWCGSILLDLAIVSTDAIDSTLSNNVDWVTTRFDNAAQAATGEICGNGIDDNCDGAADCQDDLCYCPPMLISIDGGDDCGGDIPSAPTDPELLNFLGDCTPSNQPASGHVCTVPRGTCGGKTVPSWCCDPATWSNPANNGNTSACDLGIPGCVPHDPNWLEATPHVNLWNYGYTTAGATIDYVVHYENTGTGDAHDVLILDVLGPEVDDTTLVVGDGGTYDSDSRVITWGDPVVPPNTPRSVGFSIDVNSDAGLGTRIRDVATIVFPDAEPPERTDTNFVEHVIPSPGFDPSLPNLRVSGCTETSEGSGEWTVDVVNESTAFAFDVTAAMVSPPDSLAVTDDEADVFAHPDDLQAGPTTVIPNATTTSADTVAFTATDDPCGEITWHITWEDFYGNASSVDVNSADLGDTGSEDSGDGLSRGDCGCVADGSGGCGCATGGPYAGLAVAIPLLSVLVSRRRERFSFSGP